MIGLRRYSRIRAAAIHLPGLILSMMHRELLEDSGHHPRDFDIWLSPLTIQRKGEQTLPQANFQAKERLEDELRCELNVTASVEECRNVSGVDLSLTTRNKQVGMVEGVVRFKSQLDFLLLGYAEVLV